MAERPYDIVLFGATGFTGALVADYLAAAAARESFRWAIAGRDLKKLADIASRARAAGSEPGIIQAEIGNADSLKAMAAAGRVLITTVGPYLRYGEGALQACVEAGTHYVDLTGEPEFVDRSRATWHDAAKANGTRIIHCCGFDSIPHDLGAMFTINALRDQLGDAAFREATIEMRGFVEANGSFSGGTWNSAIEQFSRARQYLKLRSDIAKRIGAARNADTGALPAVQVHALPMRINFDRRMKRWACPLPTIDPQIVRSSARERGDYGRDFSYGHFLLSDSLLPIVAGAVGIGAVFALAQFPPTANLLRKVREGGEGPSPEKRAASWFRVTFIATSNNIEVIGEVSGGDPGYDETAKMLAESALCLALDKDLPPHTGVVTPAAGMGQPLIRRLHKAGILFKRLR